MHEVYVLGSDDQNLQVLRDAPDLADCRFHPLLDWYEDAHDDVSVADLLDKATEHLRTADVRPDAIIGYWDFPISTMIPLLCERFGLRSASLESVVKCEHKYWSRLEQQKVTDACPAFELVSVDADEPPSGVDFPMWLKPVKSYGSELAYRVDDRQEFRQALASIASGIDRLGEPFEYVLDQLDLPDAIAEVGAKAVLAEETVHGQQVTLEGYCRDGEVVPYGVVDSVLYPDSPSFQRFEYPSQLPAEVVARLGAISERVVHQVGLDNTTFNVEYFWDFERDVVKLLEINPRHSQSHARLFDMVDGTPNHECLISIALGREPRLQRGKGPYNVAAKYYLRRFSDGVVRRMPSLEEIRFVEEQVPGTSIRRLVNRGEQLSEFDENDSYSYQVAQVFIGADDRTELMSKYEQCLSELSIHIDGK